MMAAFVGDNKFNIISSSSSSKASTNSLPVYGLKDQDKNVP